MEIINETVKNSKTKKQHKIKIQILPAMQKT
jgi:hypothetical protein